MALTKEDLIKYFSTLDVATLEKLRNYSRLLIIPDENLLTSVTMTQLVDKAHSLADTFFPEWTDRSKSDFGEFLVELFALFSEKDFWYINAFANESILRRMRAYSNAFSRASSLGYYPTLCCGASMDFNVTFSAGDAITYNRGELVITCNNKEFSNDEPFSVEASSAPINKTIRLHEGKQVTEDVAFTGYNVYLKKRNIDIESIGVVIANVQYTRVGNFGQSSPSSRHFLVLPEEDGSCSIYFGSDGFGFTPAVGTIIQVSYRTCEGAQGNFSLTQDIIEGTSVNDSLSAREATAATPLEDAINGTYMESLTSLKEHAVSVSARISSAFNEESAQAILNSYDFIKRSNVYALGNTLYYQAIPADGSEQLSPENQSVLVREFVPCLMLGYVGSFIPNMYVDIATRAGNETFLEPATRIELDIIVSRGFNANVVEEEIRQIFDNLTNPLLSADYGDAFSKADVEIMIRSTVSGVQSVAFYAVKSTEERQVITDFYLQPTEIFQTIDSNKLKLNIDVI